VKIVLSFLIIWSFYAVCVCVKFYIFACALLSLLFIIIIDINFINIILSFYHFLVL